MVGVSRESFMATPGKRVSEHDVRYVEHRGKLVMREVGGHRWGEHQRYVEKSNQLKSRGGNRG